jgi:predicted porin
VDVYSATGATAGSASDWKSRTRVFDNGSRFGLRGEENLGGGLKALFLMENGVAMDRGDGNGQSGAANTSVGLGARVAYVGLAANWGQLTFGRQNVFWTNGRHEQWQANYGSVGNQFFTAGFGRGMGPGVARVSNTVQYNSPVMSGVNAVISYSPNAQETAAAGAKADGELWGVTVAGTHGPAIWGWDWVNTEQNTPATGSAPKATANKLRGGWLYAPGANLSLFYIRAEQKNAGIVDATSSKLTQNGAGVVWEHTFGNFAVEANYSKVKDISGCNVAANCSNTNNNTWFLGGRYNLSKRTMLMAFYLKYRNAANYNADPFAGGMSSVVGSLANGADPEVYGFGMLHNF